jgi:DNA/RNA-binding domain of Phe-tRNA-synthetase-like protein
LPCSTQPRSPTTLEVRYAVGSEIYESFSGETEHPQAHEVVFADAANRAHARRWTNRQSAYSAVRDDTKTVLIVAEAMHASGEADIRPLLAALADELEAVWSTSATAGLVTSVSPRFEF